ncbi:MAG: DUF4380 domain-containing protein [Kiritimatiellae bacterium]|jgi:hypothetical protein|nr:DUF4380 domain-containing protein [Kiritimatiellia bacterium]
MKKKIFIFAVCLLVIALGVTFWHLHREPLLYLSNDRIELGVLPDVGGRVVIFRLKNGANILRSVPELWPQKHPRPKLGAPDKSFYGHIVWVGPQKDWWVQQDLLPGKKSKSSDWPPDPFTIFAHYKVLEHSLTNLVITAPVSPVTGLEITKEFTLDGNRAKLITTAVNRRNTPVSWNLWSNTRLPVKHAVFIPINSTNDIDRMEVGYQIKTLYMPYVVTNGNFIYDYKLDELDYSKEKLATKVFMKPAKQRFKTILDDSVFIKEMPANVQADNVHSNHTPLEFYVDFGSDGGFMEQEFHGEYKTLEPGESTTLEEDWLLLPR